MESVLIALTVVLFTAHFRDTPRRQKLPVRVHRRGQP